MNIPKTAIALLSLSLVTALGASAYLYSKSIRVIQGIPLLQYTNPCPDKGDSLLVAWSFDDISGIKVRSVTGDAFAGQLGSLFDAHRLLLPIPQAFRNFALPERIDGMRGKAMEFNGSNWVQGGNGDCFNTRQFSVALWAWKSKEKPEDIAWFVPTLAAKSNWPGNGWWLCIRPNSNELDMALSMGSWRQHIHSGFTLEDEKWHHYAVNMDHVNRTIQFFVDGEPFGDIHRDVPEWLINYDQNFFIGDYDGTGRWGWLGKIDEAHYYSKMLSAADVKQLYLQASEKPLE